MKKKNDAHCRVRHFWLWFVLVYVALPSWGGEGGPLVLNRSRSLDEWSEHVWERPPLASEFVHTFLKPRRIAGRPKEDTEVRAVLLPKGLGFAVRCIEGNPAGIAAHYGPRHHDYNLLPTKDDCVEVLIDPNRDGEKAFGIAVNSKGTVLDAIYYPRGYVDQGWESQAKPRVSITGNAWTVVMEVPFAALGIKPSSGDMIGLGFDRVRLVEGRPEVSAWPRGKTFWTWRQRRRIPDPFFYAAVLLGGPSQDLSFVSTTRGSLNPAGRPQENCFAGFFKNNGSSVRSFRFEATRKTDRGTEVFFKVRGVVHPGERKPVHCLYQAGGGELKLVEVDVWGRLSDKPEKPARNERGLPR